MRWKLLRRRLSVSSPRMTVRSHLPWPLRWAVAALALGFSAALALWAFEFGKGIAGLDVDAKQELARLRIEVDRLRAENERASSVANTAESLLKTERAAQEKLAQSVRELEKEALELRTNLAFFERLLPARAEGLAIRALRVDTDLPGRLRFQMLVMQSGKDPALRVRAPRRAGGKTLGHSRVRCGARRPPGTAVRPGRGGDELSGRSGGTIRAGSPAGRQGRRPRDARAEAVTHG